LTEGERFFPLENDTLSEKHLAMQS